VRRIFFILVLGLILAGVAFTLFKLERREGLSRSVYEAVDKESVVILDFKNPKSFFQTLEENNLIYDEFKSLGSLGEMQSFQKALDTLVSDNGAIQLLGSTRLICSAKLTQDSLNWSFYLPILPAFSESEVVNYLLDLNPEVSADELFFQLATLPKLYIGIRDRILIVSKRKEDIDSALKNIEESLGLGNDLNFKRVFDSSGKNKSLILFLQPKLALSYIEKSFNLNSEALSPFGDWLELDLILKPNSIQLDGLSQHEEALSGTASHNFKDYFGGIPKRITQLSSSSVNYNMDSIGMNLLDSMEFNYHVKWLAELKSQTKNFLANFKFYPAKDGPSETVFVLKVNDEDAFKSFMNSHEELDSTLFDEGFSTYTKHRLLWAKVLNLDSIHPLLMYRKNYLYFVRNEAIGMKITQHLQSKKVLSKDDYFVRFSENMMSQAKRTNFWAPFRMRDFEVENNSSPTKDIIAEYQSSIQKLEGISWQFGVEGTKTQFHHLFLKYNPSIEEERNTLWEFEMKQRLAMKPQVFINHYSGAKEILVQDSSKTLYLINNKGKLLWKRSLPDFILGEIHMVDKFKNKKFQILFNTNKELYLLDRKGRNVDEFPIKHLAGYSAPLQTLDYDDNKNYRILIPGNDSSLLNYTLDGKLLKGWAYKKDDYTIDAQIQYTQIRSKDYIVCHTSKGEFIALNRKGEVRLKFSQGNMIGTEGSWTIEKGSDLKKSFILALDSSGIIWKVQFQGPNSKLGQIPIGSLISIGNMDKDKYLEVFFADSLGMGFIDQDGSKETILLSSKSCKALDATLLNSYASILKSKGELLLLQNGRLIESESTLASNQLPLLMDLNEDDQLEFILGLGNQLYCFPHPN